MENVLNRPENRIKRLIPDIILFSALFVLFTVLLWRLVYCQTIYAERTDGYYSDILAYMQEMQGIDSGYSFPYPVFFAMGRFFHLFMPIDYAITLAEVILNGLAILITKYYFEKFLIYRKCGMKDSPDAAGDRNGNVAGNDRWYKHILITLAVFASFTMAMWWLPRFGRFSLPFKDQVFYGTYSGNPWHNATYIATRPFAIAAFFSFISLLDRYEKKFDLRDAVVFEISLLLTTLAKPSFTIVLISAAGPVLLFRLIRSRLRNIRNTLYFGACFLPTFVALFFQFGGVFGSGNTEEVHGIGLDFFRVWYGKNPHIPAAIFYANVFSLAVVVILFKQLSSSAMYRFTVILFAVSVLEAGLFCEKGFRYSHFNFSWGYMHGIFFFGMVSIMMLLDAAFKKKIKIPLLIICCLLLLSQVVAGALYFKGMYYGYDYNTLLPATWVN